MNVEGTHAPKDRPVTIEVNGKGVTLPDHKTTGLAIKEAAVAQGVPNVTVEFDLFRSAAGTQHQVGNDELLTVHNGQQFRMIRPDHAS